VIVVASAAVIFGGFVIHEPPLVRARDLPAEGRGAVMRPLLILAAEPPIVTARRAR
jgi:hypothetical protein